MAATRWVYASIIFISVYTSMVSIWNKISEAHTIVARPLYRGLKPSYGAW